MASELRYRHPIVDEHTLLIAVSQSGETADTIAAIRECKAHGARVLTIVNVVGSTVAKLGDYVMYTWAGPEIAVATTKGYTTQIAGRSPRRGTPSSSPALRTCPSARSAALT